MRAHLEITNALWEVAETISSGGPDEVKKTRGFEFLCDAISDYNDGLVDLVVSFPVFVVIDDIDNMFEGYARILLQHGMTEQSRLFQAAHNCIHQCIHVETCVQELLNLNL
jgi:hypothetical protein